MNYTVRFTPAAAKDLQRLFDFLAVQDVKAARRARTAIAKGLEFLRMFPFSCRKASPEHPLLRELIISFGTNGYVALFEIEDSRTVTVLAIRHQREEDFF
ncbi:plasmid stabilization protein [Sulfuriferula sp. AH1]|uniref:type II toxin-antitoxin system RelE/ParE family toxin n=1 Tax=Sulfuriferula sp. AH1 TaxID=1985873 RepID=UPI000B3B466F|nr:type II toxin-antitoxin system RelE/ParE family toxin [Sulfuriferula sp. AH1]ARU32446.1 plasmid stabilization protein [Sulfuriferula sp. AH1]